MIVSELAGTTRDAIDTPLEFDGRPLVLIDTAGIRRRTKVAGTVDYYAQLRSERAAERADVAIVVCDAAEGVTSEDLRIAELAMKTGCATLVALNKWDLDRRLRSRGREGAAREAGPPAPAGDRLLGDQRARRAEAARAGDRARRPARPTGSRPRSSTASSATSSRRTRRRRSAASACASTTRPRSAPRPPRFAIQVNDRRLITRDWAYHLENRMRERYGLEGVPLVIDFVPKRQRAGRR